jgi:hypothetical protein
MSNASGGTAAAMAPAPSKTPHTLHLTQGALYLLEGCLQEMGPCTTPAKVVLWSKVWAKVRRSNNRLIVLSCAPDGHDIEKAMVRGPKDTEIEWQHRVAEWNDKFPLWQKAPVDISLSDKHRDACREAVKWVFDNAKEGKARVQMAMNEHTALLMVQLGLAEPEADDE